MSTLTRIEPEYVYVTIPAEYICVYHRILAMLADYGEEMLKDCKAECTKKNSDVISCFNMFNSAVAARKLGKDKLAETIIKYIKAKINQIYQGSDNSTNFVFPVDEHGRLKAFVSCDKYPTIEIDSNDMALYQHEYLEGTNNHFNLGLEDDIIDDTDSPVEENGLYVYLSPDYHLQDDNKIHPCASVLIKYNGQSLSLNDVTYEYYFDGNLVQNFFDVDNLENGVHEFKIVVIYNNITKIDIKNLYYNGTTDN